MNPHQQLAHYWAELDAILEGLDPAGEWPPFVELQAKSLIVKIELYGDIAVKY